MATQNVWAKLRVENRVTNLVKYRTPELYKPTKKNRLIQKMPQTAFVKGKDYLTKDIFLFFKIDKK